MTLDETTLSGIHADLRARFGFVMSTEEVATTLKMTVPALRMARSRRVFGICPLEIEGRRGQLYCTEDIARLLSSWIAKRAQLPQVREDVDAN